MCDTNPVINFCEDMVIQKAGELLKAIVDARLHGYPTCIQDHIKDSNLEIILLTTKSLRHRCNKLEKALQKEFSANQR